MSSFRHLYTHVRTYGLKHRHLYLFSTVLLFWSIFDGIISYITPIVITGEGLSKTAMGIIYASSSVFGALFDIGISGIIKKPHFRRLFLLMFIVSFIHPLLLWQAKSVFIYLIAMASWGMYYDLLGFGSYDFVSRKMAPEEHASSFGVIDVFRGIGHVIAPVLAGLVIVALVDWKIYSLAWGFLLISLSVFISLLVYLKIHHFEYLRPQKESTMSFFKQLHIWRGLIKFAFPILGVFLFINIYDAFFWTIGPLFSEQFRTIHSLNGMFMAAYSLPVLLFGWLTGQIEKSLGKSKAIYLSLFLCSLVLLLFKFFENNPIVLFALVFATSTFSVIAIIVAKGAFTDLILKKQNLENELEALGDMSVNIGYVIGPVSAGFLADKTGNMESFVVLGIVGIMVSLFLWLVPKKFYASGNHS
ncbi:MAG: MFS transporter [Patescibacteria group bacterium]